ncbi:MAG: transcription termination factor NusA, partial [Dehalococcoidia bacterium]|nr:transcription termination factor NusA [Dehalococcoidia bacterium]
GPEQVKAEHYRIGQRLKVFVLEVFRSNKGPQVIVSRTHKNLLRRLFELEVPEIFNGTVELKAIAREPGHRSKVAVAARQEGVDPVGSCVGIRGIRIQNIINELNGEKIDVIQWSSDEKSFIANALSPSQALNVDIRENDKTATVVVPDKQLSLAIGKEGQNARLAAKLTGWRIDIRSASAAQAEAERIVLEAAELAAINQQALLDAREMEAVPVAAGAAAEEPALIKEEESAEAAALATPVSVLEEAVDAAEQVSPVAVQLDTETKAVSKEPAVAETSAIGRLETRELVPAVPATASVVQRPRLRFAEDIFTHTPAEDIFTAAPAKVGTKEKKGKSKRKTDDEASGHKFVKAKKGGGSKRPFIEEELDEFEGV